MPKLLGSVLSRLIQREVVDDSVSVEKPFPLSILIPIIIIIVLSVLVAPIFCCVFCCCRSRRHKINIAKNKNLYVRDRTSEPGLTYKMRIERKREAVDADKARKHLIQHPNEELDFPMIPGQDHDMMKARKPSTASLISMFVSAFFALRKSDRAVTEIVAKEKATRHGVGDEEMLVGAGAGSGEEMKTPAKVTVWGSDMPPVYSTIRLEEL